MRTTLRALSAMALCLALAPLSTAQNAAETIYNAQSPVLQAAPADVAAVANPVPENPSTLLASTGPILNQTGTPSLSILYTGGTVMGTTFGYGAQNSVPNRVADDFVLANDASVTRVVNYAYQTGSTAPSITGVDIEIRQGSVAGPVVCSTGGVVTPTSVTATGVFRVLDTDLSGRLREIQRVSTNISGCNLSAGTFWAVYSFTGSGASGPWAPPVPNPNENTCVGGNAQQSTQGSATFAPLVNGSCDVTLPIDVFGKSSGDPFVVTVAASGTTVAPGGSFNVTYTVTNNTSNAATGVVFFEARRNGSVVATGTVQSGTLPGNSSTGAQTFNQAVPSNAPTGTYEYCVAAGTSLGNAVAEDCFTLTIAPSARPATGATTWAVMDASEWGSVSALTASAAGEIAAFPNPFTGQTALSFSLAEAADVSLSVYDVLGRQVAMLVDGQVEAGQHTATFEADGLAAGTYIYRLQVGNEVQTGRVTLAQ